LAKIFEAVQGCRWLATGSDKPGNYINLEAEGEKGQNRRVEPLLMVLRMD
jgi:hypothetical protein